MKKLAMIGKKYKYQGSSKNGIRFTIQGSPWVSILLTIVYMYNIIIVDFFSASNFFKCAAETVCGIEMKIFKFRGKNMLCTSKES